MAFLKRRIAKTAKPLRRPFRYEPLEPRRLLAADPIITEFAATNSGFLLDGYGASPDWVEIHNRGDASVDLAGYSLTDEADELDKWQFPQVVLDPGEYLIVYASGLDTVDPAGHLHTNFGLSASGEYLALVSPSEAILSEFGSAQSDYPAQETNDSYGLPYDSTFTQVVSPGSAVRYLVPSNGDVDATWTSPAFDDTGWSAGLASLGNETEPGLYADLIETTLPLGSRSAYVRIPFNVSDATAKLGTLNVRFDDGFVAYLNGSPIAEFNAPEVVTFDSWATEFRTHEAAIENAALNISEYSDLLVVGDNVLAIHILDVDLSPSSDLLFSVDLNLATGDLAAAPAIGSLIAPTPGQPNTQVRSAEVSFSRPSGVFTGEFQLGMTASPGESIRYTLDGSQPDETSSLYTGSITIAATSQVRARSFGLGGQVGRVTSGAFTKTTASLSDFSSNLPVVVVENFGSGVPGRTREEADLAIYDTNETTGRSSLADQPVFTSKIGYNRRGSSTFGLPKPSFRVELQNEEGEDRDAPLLGMPADSDWILYGPHITDRSMLRNTVMYDLSGQYMPYAIRTRYVEVYYNSDDGILDQSDYLGVYVLMENIKIGESRVNIEEPSPADIRADASAGGYVLKVDRSDGLEDSSWSTSRGTPGPSRIVHVEPNRSEMTAAQVESIRGDINDFENALNGPNSTDPDLGYAAHIDVDSWIDHHLLRVFSREGDAVVLSEHLYKPAGGKLTFGPVWDFDRSLGSEGAANKEVEGWNGHLTNVFGFGWWGELFDDPNFKQLWADRWQELRSTIYSDENLESTVLRQAGQLTEAEPRNSARWTTSVPNGGALADPGLSGWEAEVSHIINWMTARASWIDFQMATRPAPVIEAGSEAGVVTLTFATEFIEGDIYYTIDGSDPRADGGGFSAEAVLYQGPTLLTGGVTQVAARTFTIGKFTSWSRQAVTLIDQPSPADASNLRISELHYNPLDPTSAELQALPGIDNNAFEFVELLNVSGRSIDLNGVRFTEGIAFDFSSSEEQLLGPGETILIVQNRDAFELRYGNAMPIAGEYSGRLSGGGEDLELVDAMDAEIQAFEYEDESPWPEAADGDGPSLESVDPLGDPTQGSNWVASAVDGGTPGSATAPLLGDYDRNGLVDELDRSVWINQYGSTVAAPGVGPDGNRDGVVDAADYSVWRDQLGQTQIQLALVKESEADDSSQQLAIISSRSTVAAPGVGPDGNLDGAVDAADDSNERPAIVSSRAMPIGYSSNEYKPLVRPRLSREQAHLDNVLALEDDLLMLNGPVAAGAALPNAGVGSTFDHSGDHAQSEQPEGVDAAFAALSEAPWVSFKGL